MRDRRRIIAMAVALCCALPVPAAAAQDAEQPDQPPPTVTVLGGVGALGPGVTDQLEACTDAPVRRVAGSDRYATAAALSHHAFPAGAADAVVASGTGFADALAAGPAAARLSAPLLLAHAGGVPQPTMDELRRLAPQRITMVGGHAALSAEVERALATVAPVRRVAGPDRFATAAALAPPAAPFVWVTTGTTWPDALTAGPAAATQGAGILLVTRDEIPRATRDALLRARPEQVVLVGGTGAVSPAVEQSLRELTGAEVTRLAGADRFATAAEVADHAYTDAGAVMVATGAAFADGLASVPAAFRSAAPLLLASGSVIPTSSADVMRRLGATRCRSVLLEPTATERTALGGGVLLTVAGPTGAVPVGTVATPLLLEHAADLQIAYPASRSGGPTVAWSQRVETHDDRVLLGQPWRGERPPAPGGITAAWHAGGSWERYRQEVERAPGLTISAPVSMHLDSSGALTGGLDAGFVAAMRSRGVGVWATVASLDADVIRRAVSDPARRARLASDVSERARAAGAVGVNIDIEGWTHDTTEAVTDFTRRLTEAVHAWGGVTSIDLVSMSDTWATPPSDRYGHWSTAPQRRELSAAVDYVALMAYDEHNRLRPAGPVASPRWVEQVVRYQLRFTDPDRLILGVPLYGRLWDPGQLDRPRAIPIGQVAALSRQGRRTPDPARGVDRVDLADGRFLWAEDHAGLRHRTELVRQLGLAGTASWRLGFDDAAVWPVLTGR